MRTSSKIDRISSLILASEEDWVSKEEYPRPPREWGSDYHETSLGWGKGKQNNSQAHSEPVKQELDSHRQSLAQLAQKEYNEWTQDDDGVDEFLGTGGICDQISDSFSSFLTDKGFHVDVGGQDGDDHAFIYATKNGNSFLVDIPPSVYEIGGGYSWKKRNNVAFKPSDIVIEPVR